MDVEQKHAGGAKMKHFRGTDDLNQADDLTTHQLLERNVEAAAMQTPGVDRVAMVNDDGNGSVGYKVYHEDGTVTLIAMKKDV